MNIKLKNNPPKEIRLNNQSVAFEKTNTQFKIHFFFVKQTKKWKYYFERTVFHISWNYCCQL
jgi:hypothetical protein